ncbi:SMC family ATPase, partial [Nocardioides sp.]|uniref:SMC family ATPase n=1 Tax=Nocardioides sp. TaxID=35761 RepID=UPI002727F483
ADAVARHEQRLAAVTEVLRDAGQADDGPAPDVDAAIAAHDHAHATSRRTAADVALHQGRSTRLSGLLAELDEALAAWAPLRRDLALVTRLAAFVDGRSPDNLLRMRLSAFVLAYRLSQVVDAANERLARMSDQRYSLEHTGRRGAGETRGGLSLLVRDDWSGESRDPATLSGGETFVVSLALALGLADVIAHEAGGAALDTLFVDEGFGSLDADTLDDVMDTLDALRDGGRVVGVVSHVAEMRDRIPTQLVVSKSRRGSSVALRR